MEAIVYALGLEGMVSFSHDLPLRQAVTEQIETDVGLQKVLESDVYLEIECGSGERMTVRRSVVGPRDRRLIEVWNGPALSSPAGSYGRAEYFVRVGGGATREAGFHALLTKFLHWQLPAVPRFDGGDVPLYLECLFPLFIIEQKKAWAVLPARFPQYLKIREVAKRALEFLLDLDAYRNAQKRRQIESRITELNALWKAAVQDSNRIASEAGAVVQNLPVNPTASWPPMVAPRVVVAKGESWRQWSEALVEDQAQLYELENIEIPQLQQVAADVQEKLAQAQEELAQKEFVIRELYEALQAETAQHDNAAKRIEALEEDLRRYQDLARLKEFGAAAKSDLQHGRCPTCHQDVTDSLLPQTGQAVMSLEENIGFFNAQLNIFTAMKNEAQRITAAYKQRIRAIQEEANALRERIRALRQSLISDGRLPSLEAVEERLRLRRKVQDTRKAQEAFAGMMAEFEELSLKWRSALDELHALPRGDVSPADLQKLRQFQDLFVAQLQAYGLSSVNPRELEISVENYRPIREGFDIDFNNSASDLIRTHWAYITALLELARTKPTNHPGLLVLDEPRQQGTSWESFSELLKRLSSSGAHKQQVIIATSERAEPLEATLRGIAHHYLPFDGWILGPLKP